MAYIEQLKSARDYAHKTNKTKSKYFFFRQIA